MSLLVQAGVVSNRELVPGHFRMVLEAPEVAAVARPGQFVHVRCAPLMDPLLRRPISIHDVDRRAGRVHLLYRVSGRGTALLAQNSKLSTLDIMGPLGNGFSLPRPPAGIVVVGGGIGIAPLVFLVRDLVDAGNQVRFLAGFRSVRDVMALDELEMLGVDLALATDDGSAGLHGLVTDLLDAAVEDSNISFYYACGPRPMLQQVTQILARRALQGEVSMEERMACGVGACLSCACKTRDQGPEGFRYRHVCVDGPVFPAGEVIW